MPGATIEFEFADARAEQRFLTAYLTDAWQRYESSPHWTQGWFWPYSQVASYDVGVDGGLVRLVFDGEPAELVTAESDRWAAVDGLRDWTVEQYDQLGFDSLQAQQQDAKGAVGGEFEYNYKPLTARLALALRQEFDHPLDPAPEPSDENPLGVGMWSLVHSLYVQCGYDWYEETDSLLRAMESRVKSVASYRGAEAARAEYDRLLEEWQAFDEELEAWLETHPVGEASV